MSGEWECRKACVPANNNSIDDRNNYDNYYNTYTSLNHASLWIRQRALRLIINSIFIKTIAIRLHTSSEQTHLLWKQNRMRNNLASRSSELCGDVSYFIMGAPTSGIESAMTDAVEQEVLPKFASLVAWPLAVAVSTENVPESQRQWLQQKLRVVADSLGDSVLGQVANRHEFDF